MKGFKVVEGAGNFSHVYFDKRLEYFHERLRGAWVVLWFALYCRIDLKCF